MLDLRSACTLILFAGSVAMLPPTANRLREFGSWCLRPARLPFAWQAMLAARQNPEIEVHTGQRALMRLTEAESQALSMSPNLRRVHDELSKLAQVHAGGDMGGTTVIPREAVTTLAAEPAKTHA